MRYIVRSAGASRSFPEGLSLAQRQSSAEEADIIVYSGSVTGFTPDAKKVAILIELQHECLAEHIGEHDPASANVLGFARYRNGDDPPSRLVELVHHRNSSHAAIEAARQLFEAAGLETAVCSDQVGRIIDRLVVPKYNAALRFLDEGLATQGDMDLTCKLGLGYPDGPIERVVRGGLASYYELSRTLFESYGTPAYTPPRAAAVAFRREGVAREPKS
jgi:3-hydroxybutyryl-CoA dehydrogenase